MSQAVKIAVGAARTRAEKAAMEWLKKNEGSIEDRVKVLLDRSVQEVVAKLMGFNNGWGAWEVDHCNGRAGNSAAGEFIRKKAATAVDKWLEEQAGSLPTLPKTAVSALRSEYIQEVKENVSRRLGSLASDKANEIVNEIVGDVFVDTE